MIFTFRLVVFESRFLVELAWEQIIRFEVFLLEVGFEVEEKMILFVILEVQE